MTPKGKPESQFKQLLSDLTSMPPWVIEAIYVQLGEYLKNHTDSIRLKNINAKDNLFLYVPRLTRLGLNFLASLNQKPTGADKNFLAFIHSVKNQSNMMDIAQDNDWTLKVCCKYVMKAWEKNIILPTYSKHIYALVRLLAGDIGFGEYLVRVGRITKEQLNWVVSMSKSGMMTLDENEQSDLEDICVNLGYVNSDEVYYIKRIIEFSETNSPVETPTGKMAMRAAELEKELGALDIEHENLKMEKKALLEEKDELERKIQKLSEDIEVQKTEANQYSKEVEILKTELKKALKS